jgi:hypothetical protein
MDVCLLSRVSSFFSCRSLSSQRLGTLTSLRYGSLSVQTRKMCPIIRSNCIQAVSPFSPILQLLHYSLFPYPVEARMKQIRGGRLEIQGTWFNRTDSGNLAARIAYPFAKYLVPLFGPDFPAVSDFNPNSRSAKMI